MFVEDEEDDRSFVQRHAGLVLLVIILVVAPGMFILARKLSSGRQSSIRPEEIMIRLPPPPPPPKPRPTPTPDQTPPPEEHQKMIENQPVQDVKIAPPKEKAPEALGTSIKGPGGGPDLGLGSGLGGGGGYGSGGEGGSKYGFFASQVQKRIAEAVRNNPATRKATMHITVRIWPDSTGRITKARISGSTGDPALDRTLQDDILTGLQLPEPPPADMPLPIVMRLTAQRPQ